MLRALLLALVLTSTAHAQLSGGSFGSSGDFGGGSSSSSWGGGSSGSSWGGGSSSNDWAEQERDRAEERRRAAEEARQRAEEERRRAEEERRRREEEERRRREEEERRRIEAARQLAEDLALPPRRRAALRRRFHTTEDEVELPRSTLGDAAPLSSPTRVPAATVTVPPTAFHHAPLWGLLCGLLGFASFGGFFWALSRLGRAFRNRPRPVRRAPRGTCELRRISLAFDPSERPAIQAALASMAQRLDLRSSEGRLQAAQEVVSMLLQRIGAARYAVWSSAFVSPQAAKGRLHVILNDLKSRYRYDVTRGDRVDVRARAEEGDGLVVVSVVVGATRWLPALPGRLGHSELAQALRGAVSVSARDFVALEVLWSPALETDRMSSLELETIYPELLRLDAGPLGRTACPHCHAVHTAELPRCPACGAPTGATSAFR
ncbi:MAG: DUF1517 domain-containing protein [Sandaracinus sp.]|nr:DUF1517 domain-containing protein [Sandaracinus sp.]MCB9631716.1 DUF1517 domain-containing protein [Sandaracinus sp.]